jgi:hypothetical protein
MLWFVRWSLVFSVFFSCSPFFCAIPHHSYTGTLEKVFTPLIKEVDQWGKLKEEKQKLTFLEQTDEFGNIRLFIPLFGVLFLFSSLSFCL